MSVRWSPSHYMECLPDRFFSSFQSRHGSRWRADGWGDSKRAGLTHEIISFFKRHQQHMRRARFPHATGRTDHISGMATTRPDDPACAWADPALVNVWRATNRVSSRQPFFVRSSKRQYPSRAALPQAGGACRRFGLGAACRDSLRASRSARREGRRHRRSGT